MAFLEEEFGYWKPVSRIAGIAWLCFYALFLLYALTRSSSFLFLDYVNLIIHRRRLARPPPPPRPHFKVVIRNTCGAGRVCKFIVRGAAPLCPCFQTKKN